MGVVLPAAHFGHRLDGGRGRPPSLFRGLQQVALFQFLMGQGYEFPALVGVGFRRVIFYGGGHFA